MAPSNLHPYLPTHHAPLQAELSLIAILYLISLSCPGPSLKMSYCEEDGSLKWSS
jgi:hypothetical protein